MTLHLHSCRAFSWQHQQTINDVQAVIVCIRLATYIGVTILVVALAYKVAKVKQHCAWHAAKQVPSIAECLLCMRVSQQMAQLCVYAADRPLVYIKYCCSGRLCCAALRSKACLLAFAACSIHTPHHPWD